MHWNILMLEQAEQECWSFLQDALNCMLQQLVLLLFLLFVLLLLVLVASAIRAGDSGFSLLCFFLCTVVLFLLLAAIVHALYLFFT